MKLLCLAWVDCFHHQSEQLWFLGGKYDVIISRSGLSRLWWQSHSCLQTAATVLKKLFWVRILPLFCLVMFIHEWVTTKCDLRFLFHVQFESESWMLTKELNWSCFSCCPRFWRRKVHLVWGPPMASAVLHLLPVLSLAGGRWFFPERGQDLVPWMQQQPLHAIETLLTMYLLVHVLTLALTKLLNFFTRFKSPSWLRGKKTQLNKCHHWKMILWGISLLLFT